LKTQFCNIFCCLVILFSSYAQATRINDIYSASIPVVNQLSEGRSSAFDQALFTVAIKSSGQLDQLSDIALLRTLLPAEPFVQSFSYRENPAYNLYLDEIQAEKISKELSEMEGAQRVSSSDVDHSPTEILAFEESLADKGVVKDSSVDAPLPFLLDVTFAPSLVEKKMKQLNIPLWGAVRPSVLLWLVIENEGDRSIVGTSDENPLISQFEHSSYVRGVPLFLPVADLEDVNNINVDELWGLFPATTELSSKRYNADAIVIARMKEGVDANWAGNWLVQLKGSQYYGSSKAESSAAVVTALVSHVADTLSKKYAIGQRIGQASDLLDIEVNEINSFDDYVGIINYLQSLPPVSQVEMTKVNTNKLYFHVTLHENSQQFYEHIELGSFLEPLRADVGLLKTPDEQIETNSVERFVWVSGK